MAATSVKLTHFAGGAMAVKAPEAEAEQSVIDEAMITAAAGQK
jgi:hypothetical protein